MPYKDPDKQKEYLKKHNIKYRAEHKEEKKRNDFRKNRRYRLRALSRVGRGKIECKCCGERRWEFLAIDHIYNDGYLERRNRRTRGDNQAFNIEKKKVDISRLQLLCHNCNVAKSFYNGCPHMREQKRYYCEYCEREAKQSLTYEESYDRWLCDECYGDFHEFEERVAPSDHSD